MSRTFTIDCSCCGNSETFWDCSTDRDVARSGWFYDDGEYRCWECELKGAGGLYALTPEEEEQMYHDLRGDTTR